MVTITQKGDFSKTKKFFNKLLRREYLNDLAKFGQEGVNALMAATPKDTGKTAASWSFEIETNERGARIYWTNSNVNKGVNIAVILQYGHGTGSGYYVAGIDYINPALHGVFNKIADDAWKKVTMV